MNKEIKDILTAFPVTAVTKVEPVKKNVYKIIGKQQSYCLKLYPSLEKLERSLHILRYLRHQGFNSCDQVIPTRTKQPYVLDNTGGWQLTKWVVGKQPDFRNKIHLRDAILLLAEFHQAGTMVPFQSGTASHRYDTLYEQWQKRYNDLEQWKSEYGTPYLNKAVELAGKSLEALQNSSLEEVSAVEYQQKSIVHGDYNYPNLIRKQSGKTIMIDFENAAHDIRIRDLAHIIQRNIYKDSKKAQWAVRTYEKKRKLTKKELGVLAALLAFPYQFWREIHIRRFHQKPIYPVHVSKWGKQYLSRRYTEFWRSVH